MLSVQTVIQDDQFSLLASDRKGNTISFGFAPDGSQLLELLTNVLSDPDSAGGRLLLRRAEFNLNARPTAMTRFLCASLTAR